MPDPPEIPNPEDHDERPPQFEDRELNLDESDNDEPEIIDNADSEPEVDANPESPPMPDRPRRGNVYLNDNPFMKGRYIVLEAKPVDEEDQDRAYECCLCQLRYKNAIHSIRGRIIFISDEGRGLFQ